MPRVIIVDPDPILRNGLKYFLTIALNYDVVEADALGRLIDHLRRERFDLVIVDHAAIDQQRFEEIRELRREFSEIPIVFIGPKSDYHHSVRAFRSGVNAYLSAGADPEELADAISTVLRGRTYLDRRLTNSFVDTLRGGGEKAPHERLTPREFEVFIQVALGYGLKEIAANLNVSVKTVSTHKRNISRKTNLKSAASIVLYAVQHKLIDP